MEDAGPIFTKVLVGGSGDTLVRCGGSHGLEYEDRGIYERHVGALLYEVQIAWVLGSRDATSSG